MASAYSRIKTLIQDAADATSDNLHKWLLGDSANAAVRYPEAWSHSTKMRTRGRLWEYIIFPAVLGEVGTEMDTHGICWAYFDTNATLNAPTITAASQVTSVTKDEGTNRVTINFSINYTGVNDYVCFSTQDTSLTHQTTMNRAAGNVTLAYYDTAGLIAGINNRTVGFAAIGLR